MRRGIILLLLAGLVQSATGQETAEERVIVIKMVDKSTAEWRFEPANVEVQPGDIIRWVQEDIVPHNVEFKNVPEGADLGDIVMGPYVFAKGETYELTIDQRFVEGAYSYVCTPHDPLGMKATFTVGPARETETN